MNLRQLTRANEIHTRLRHIERAMDRLNESSCAADLMMYLAQWGQEQVMVAAPVAQFQRSCLDALATERAALTAEFNAL